MYRVRLSLSKGYDCKVFPNYYSLLQENQYYRENISHNKSEYLNN